MGLRVRGTMRGEIERNVSERETEKERKLDRDEVKRERGMVGGRGRRKMKKKRVTLCFPPELRYWVV